MLLSLDSSILPLAAAAAHYRPDSHAPEYETRMRRVELGLIMGWFWLADRSGHFPDGDKVRVCLRKRCYGAQRRIVMPIRAAGELRASGSPFQRECR
jgi:hypothetical protein